jgi:hypothetical protein
MRREWLREALFAGQTANGFKIGTALTGGWFWMRVNGCRLVYRGFDMLTTGGQSMGTIDFDNVIAVADPETDEIRLPDYTSHEAGEDYFYVVRCANRCGQIERTLQAAVKVSIDSEGKLEAGKPNSVFGLGIKREADGKIELVWGYYPNEQESKPSEMRIYTDEGTGEINYQQPTGIVKYNRKRCYQYKCEIAGSGRERFAVRAADSEGNEQKQGKLVEIETSGRSIEAIEVIDCGF